jgi:predicted Zn-dependent peptidase
MRKQDIQISTLENGIVLVVEPMVDVQSAAFSLLVPAGSIYDPPGQNGNASVLCELITRGAGEWDSKQLSCALDNLGVQRHESVGTGHITFTGATLADNLPSALRIYGDILRKPHLPADQFSAARMGVEQTLRALEDEPRQKIIVELRRRTFDSPWGLPTDGTLEELESLTAQSVCQQYERCFRPNGMILGVAGCVDPEAIRGIVEEIFGDWKSLPVPGFEVTSGGPSRDHIPHDSTQTHIAIAYPTVPYNDPEYYEAWAAVSVLSGGMSSRLFTEVREKRGLCYAVHASLSSLKDDARVLCYAGTTSERAQETLDVTLREILRLGEGIEENELERCRARAKSSLVMQQESTLARSSSIARDWYHLGRVTQLTEVREKIDGLTVESVQEHLHKHPAGNFTIVTIGQAPLEVACEVS